MELLVPGAGQAEPGTGPLPPELPRGFLHSLRTLFDILDDERRGSVHILEIESRWQDGSGRALPPGVLQCLRRVAPASGYLTFHSFVSGLRSSLLSPGNNRYPGHSGEADKHREVWKRNKTDPGRRNGQQPCSRGSSVLKRTQPVMIHHCPKSDVYRGHGDRAKSPLRIRSMNIPETRTELDGSPQKQGECKPAEIGRELRVQERKANADPRLQVIESLALEGQRYLKADGRPMGRYQSETTCGGITSSRRQARNRSELRRHTITSGVDYDRLKCMKELEREKDALLQGLEMVDSARGWYIQQIQETWERQRNIKSPAGSGADAEGNSVRLEQLLSKLQEVKRCLADLTSCSAKRLARSSTAVNVPECHAQCSIPARGNTPQVVLMLKEQNRQLTQEVSVKSDRITQLEQEKSALIKQLFTARSRNHHESSQLDSTFI
ncbi:suppressor APC domain-containing protein 2 isoform X1 [Scyliorhinus torazame]|uniref:suppressor APC domain-containing protein 2 isoform X1 n=1 Tax=Scyliorhinus torazame TaxID=75743 RepID=UPI003B5B22F0